MLDKYIKMNDAVITVGQTSQGFWYCKELPCHTTKEAELLIGEMNTILNKYNKKEDEKKKK